MKSTADEEDDRSEWKCEGCNCGTKTDDRDWWLNECVFVREIGHLERVRLGLDEAANGVRGPEMRCSDQD